MPVRIKRIYERPSHGEGHRVLIDGVWPRGISRERAAVDQWARELAPSAQLRRWYGHEPALRERCSGYVDVGRRAFSRG